MTNQIWCPKCDTHFAELKEGEEMFREMDKRIIEDLFKCRCEIQTLMAHGCQCGGK